MVEVEGIAPNMCWGPQGPIARAIIVDEEQMASEHPVDACDAVGDFAGWAVDKAMLVPGEFPDEALLFHDFSNYYWQVVNGGHAQFVKNSAANCGELDPAMLGRVERLLDAIGAREHRGVFCDFVAFLSAMPEPDRRALASTNLAEFPARFEELNRRFFGSEEDENALWERVRHWLQGLPVLRKVPFEVMQAERAAIIAANPLREARLAAAEAEQAEAQARDPVFSAIRTLCAAAELEFVRFHSGHGSSAFYKVNFVTAGGRRSLHIRGGRAHLMDENGKPTGHSCECRAKFEDGGWS